MTLDELKAKWEAAAAEAAKDSENADLKAKAEAAKAEYDAKKAEEDQVDPDALDEDSLDEKTKAHIAKLRKENASHRTKAKDLASKLKTSDEQKKAILKAAGIEDESEKPEERVKTLTATSQQLAFRSAILEAAVEHGIAKDQLEFFEFLVQKEAGKLEENEELSDEQLAEIVAKVKKQGAGVANTSVEGDEGGNKTPAPNGGNKGVTLDQFVRMSMTQKSELYTKNPKLYEQLVTEAKAKKRLV